MTKKVTYVEIHSIAVTKVCEVPDEIADYDANDMDEFWEYLSKNSIVKDREEEFLDCYVEDIE